MEKKENNKQVKHPFINPENEIKIAENTDIMKLLIL